MKLYFFSTVLILITCFSYGQVKSEQLIGTWTLDYETSIKKNESFSKNIFGRMPETKREETKALYKGRVINLDVEGNYKQTLADGRSIDRKWVLKGNKLIIIGPGEHESIFLVKELNDSSLVLKLQLKGKIKTLIKDWYYIKN